MANVIQKVTPFPVTDILIIILSMVDKPTRAVAARVCRRWNEVALSQLWKSMDSVFPLLKLLAPVEYFCGFKAHKDVRGPIAVQGV